MYVCICNALSERMVLESIEGGVKSVAQVYRAHGCRPQCGRCGPEMRKMLKCDQGTEPGRAERKSR